MRSTTRFTRYPDTENRSVNSLFRLTAIRIRMLPLFLLLMPGILPAQNTNTGGTSPSSSSMQKIFDEEMEKYIPTARNGNPMKPLRSILPENWNSFPVRTEDTIYMIGISDPGIPPEVAHGQAMLRATGLAALTMGCRGEHFSDYFLKSSAAHTDSKFEEIYQITASTAIHPSSVVVHRSSLLKSGEQMVIAAIPLHYMDSGRDPTLTHGYLYQYDAVFGGAMQIIRRVSYTTSCESPSHPSISPDSVSFYLVNKRFTGIRNLQQKISPETTFDYYYLCPGPEQPDSTSGYTGSTCRSGLWIALLDQIWEQLSFYLKNHSAQTRKVQDSSPDQSNELNRETNGLNLQFIIEQIRLSENKLMVKTNITHEN